MATAFINLGTLRATALPSKPVSLVSSSVLQTAISQANISALASAANVTPVAVAPAPPRAEPLVKPTYDQAASKFGVMRQIDPVRDHFSNAVGGLKALRDTAIVKGGGQAASLIDRVEKYLLEHKVGEFDTLLKELAEQNTVPGAEPPRKPVYFRDSTVRIGGRFELAAKDVDAGNAAGAVASTHNAHSALFALSRVVIDDIRVVETLYQLLLGLRRNQQKALADLQADLDEIDDALPAAVARLDLRERQRVEELDDYAVAQQVLAEHWRSVEAAWVERARVINSHQGLYYVKVRETPLGRTLPDPLDLRYTSADDLVPGCGPRDTPLSDELLPFMDAVLDIPVADWAVLNGLAHLLPGPQRLAPMVSLRQQRLALRPTQSANTLAGLTGKTAPALGRLVQHNLLLAGELAQRPFNAASLLDLQRQGHAILALEDLLASPVPLLREPARALHQRLDGAAGCLLARIRAVTPSLRLAWAEAAEADTLAVDTPERWPGLAQAEQADFNGVRTLVELVAWWFRQLDADAAGASRTALRNLIRACMLLAAGDDPGQLLQGRIAVLPARLSVGETLRLQLNRVPPPGALLQLTDDHQRVVGELRVHDHDVQGTVARFTRVFDAQALLSTASRVSGRLG
jgi:hypothetical protein